VTEREVINGILNVQNTKNHCLAYVRYINNINLQNLKKASLFVDILNRSLDTEASKLLANLRDERLPAKIESTNLQRWYQLYPIHGNKSCESTPTILTSSCYVFHSQLPSSCKFHVATTDGTKLKTVNWAWSGTPNVLLK